MPEWDGPIDDGDFARPRVVVSRCLGLDACRFNGATASGAQVEALAPHVELVDVCPEVAIGLGTPRPPVRLVADRAGPRMVQPQTERDVTAAMERWSVTFLAELGPADGFLLKAGSPSCGPQGVKRYAASGAPTGERGAGLFAAAVLEARPDAAVEDEARLSNPHLRHHFLMRIHASARLRAAAATGRIAALLDFHARYKLVLMAQAPAAQRSLGAVLASQARRPFAATVALYAEGFERAMVGAPGVPRMVNVLEHAFGYVSRELSPAERRHFIEVVAAYRADRVGPETPLALLASWLRRFDRPWLEQQALFAPYPAALRPRTATRIPAALPR